MDAVCDEEGNELNIVVTVENADAGNDVRGSVVVLIPQKEFEKIETTGEFKQINLETLGSDVLVHTNNATVTMDLTAKQLNHNITLAGSESIDDSDGLLTEGQLEAGSGTPVISIDHADKVELYMDAD